VKILVFVSTVNAEPVKAFFKRGFSPTILELALRFTCARYSLIEILSIKKFLRGD
tara:strand:- start:2577 stop:2741 length:165 start_codon:yes stop_codon:yes gene_type:complete